MNTQPTAVPNSIDSLLAHADWVRALARHLVRDPQAADDVEQEVWRAALENPPRHDANPRGWLASVARNAARALKRGEGRRARREGAAARPEGLPSTAQLVEEASLSRELAGVVLQLDEPYRTTILLRYYRDLSVEQIADAQRSPRETVRTRQRRALEILRERLDAARGGRAQWLAAFAPLARVETVPVAVASGFGGLGWVAAAGVIAVGAWLAWPERAAAPEISALPTGGAPVEDERRTVEAPGPGASARVGAGAAARTADTASAASAFATSAATVSGRVVDPSGRPVGGLEVVATPTFVARIEGDDVVVPTQPSVRGDGTRVHGGLARFRVSPSEREAYARVPEALEEELARFGHAIGLREALLGLPAPRAAASSDGEGRFALALSPDAWTFDVADPRLVVVTQLGTRGAPDWTLVVAPAVRVSGVVVDESGAPVAGAQVQHMTSDDALRELLFARGESRSSLGGSVQRVDAAGRFDLGRVASFPRDTISASAEGREGATAVVPTQDTSDLRLVLRARRVDPETAHLRGLVVHADGRPAAGASVHLGQDQTTAGADGRFDLELSCCHDGMPLAATLAGYQAALVPGFGTAHTAPRDDLVLRLGPPALTIRGHVTGPMGKPIGGAHVQILDGSAFSNLSCWAEDASCGRYSSDVTTDASGAFELGGLFDRTYRLGAWWDENVMVVSEPIPAGTSDAFLRFDLRSVHPEVRGRVVTRTGAPLAGVEVAARVDTFRAVRSTSWRSFGRVTTDADGAFVVRHVPRELARLVVSGPGVVLRSVDLPADVTGTLDVVVGFAVRVELDVADERIDTVRFLDTDGRALHVELKLPGVTSAHDRVRRKDGVFPPFDLTDDAVTAVLLAGETEVRRAPIRLERVATLRLGL